MSTKQPSFSGDSYSSLIARFSGLVKRYGGFNLAQGIPGFQPPRELLDQLIRVIGQDVHQYPPGQGNPELIRAIISRYRHLKELGEDQVTVMQGATEAVSLSYLYVRQLRGGSLTSLAFDPVYESYGHLPRIYGDQLIRFPIQEADNLEWDRLEEILRKDRPGLVFLNSPGNPTGRVWRMEELQIINDWSEQYDFHVLFDGVYLETRYEDDPVANPLVFKNSNWLYANSFSKMLSITGWRVGYLISDASHMRMIRDIHDYTGLCASAPMQEAVARYLTEPDSLERYLTQIRKKLKTAADLVCPVLRHHGFQFADPRAGYFLWAELPPDYPDSMDFCLRLYEQARVAMVPGVHFSDQGQRFVRINIAREARELEQAMKALESFLSA